MTKYACLPSCFSIDILGSSHRFLFVCHIPYNLNLWVRYCYLLSLRSSTIMALGSVGILIMGSTPMPGYLTTCPAWLAIVPYMVAMYTRI